MRPRRQYLEELRKEYQRADKVQRGRLADEGRRTYGHGFAPATAVHAEVSHVGRDYRVFGVQLT